MKYGLIAERVGHSFSAEIHKKLFGYNYELCAVSRDELDEFMTKRNFKAINVTIPYKEAVIPYLDFIDETAREIGAVNTVVNREGKLYGYNTDIDGLVAMINRIGVSIKGKKVLILGSGGTSNTALYAAKRLGCSSVYRASRREKDGCISYETAISEHSDADVIINTTPCGMYPDIYHSAVDLSAFTCPSGVIDVVYNPLRPKLVCDAIARGIPSCGGLYMLVSQAASAAEKFIGETADESEVESIYNDLYRSKQNIVLVGMPGSGKSTVGSLLASSLDREHIDVDKEITAKLGLPPHEIINTRGEKAFRDIESDIIKEISSRQGLVISTGGGSVLRSENIELLRENGRIYFLDRPLSAIKPTADRPLSASEDALKKRFEERYPIYLSCCDFRVECPDTAEATEKLILEDWNK